jgi:hypothetical protein
MELVKERGLCEEIIANGKEMETWLEELLKRRNLGKEAENPACSRIAIRLCISEDETGLNTIFSVGGGTF